MRKVFSRIAVGFLLACPFIVTTLLLAEVWLRWTTNLPFLSRTSCFTQNPREAPAFRENCRELLRTPQAPVEFQTNAEGFRDRPREFFAKGAIGVLGDSYVEGFWLPDNSGPVRSLERAMGGAIPFLNLGIRGSGPSQQAIRFFRAVKSGYRFRGLIWFLNPSDPVDERYFLAQNPGFRIVDGNWPDLKPLWEPSRTYWIWTHLSLFFRDKVYLFLYMA